MSRTAVTADQFHREHAVVELVIRDLKEGTGAQHIPSGNYSANAAWFTCAVLAHNLSIWTGLLAESPQLVGLPTDVETYPLAPLIVLAPTGVTTRTESARLQR